MITKRKKNGHFVWIVEISVDEKWVEDGFELTQERLENMLQNELSYSYSHETSGKILGRPAIKEIREIQGY